MKKTYEWGKLFFHFFRSKCISYISDSSRSSMNDYLQAAHNYIMYTMFLLTYVQLENDCLNKWHEILGRRLAYSLQAYNTAWTINFTKIVNITNLHCKVYTFWEGHKNLRYLHCRFNWHYIGQISQIGLLRIYELY